MPRDVKHLTVSTDVASVAEPQALPFFSDGACDVSQVGYHVIL